MREDDARCIPSAQRSITVEIFIEGMFEATLARPEDEFAGRAPEYGTKRIFSRAAGVC